MLHSLKKVKRNQNGITFSNITSYQVSFIHIFICTEFFLEFFLEVMGHLNFEMKM